MTAPLLLHVHPSQWPAATRTRLEAALRAHTLPARFLYDSPAQAARWLAYHAAWSPSRTEAELLDLYDQAFEAALSAVAHAAPTYLSLGTGGGRKDARFRSRAHAAGRAPELVLTDTSPALVMEAMQLSPGARGWVVDLEAEPSRESLDLPDAPLIVSAFGMVPNLDAHAFTTWMRGLLRPGDLALVSANLHPDPWPEAGPDILPQYDNPPARAWYAGALAELGLSEASLEIRGRALDSSKESWRVEVDAVASAAVVARAFDVELPLESGERFSVFFSNRFTPAAFERLVTEVGFAVRERYIFEGAQEGIWLLAPE